MSLKKYSIFIGILVIVLASSIFFFWKKVSLKDSDVTNISEEVPVHKLDAKTVIDLIKNEEKNIIEPEQIVEIEGVVREINYLNNRITILLSSGTSENAFVICDMQNNQSEEISNINPTDTIKLKGIFKGFLEDAIFLNCIISQ